MHVPPCALASGRAADSVCTSVSVRSSSRLGRKCALWIRCHQFIVPESHSVVCIFLQPAYNFCLSPLACTHQMDDTSNSGFVSSGERFSCATVYAPVKSLPCWVWYVYEKSKHCATSISTAYQRVLQPCLGAADIRCTLGRPEQLFQHPIAMRCFQYTVLIFSSDGLHTAYKH